MVQPILLNGQWVPSLGSETFQATNPTTKEVLAPVFPVSPWEEIQQALQHAFDASVAMRGWPGVRFATFLRKYADEIEVRSDALVDAAHAETALPASPRLRDGELPRTTNQLRQAATAAESDSWRMPTIDTATNIRACYGPIGPVVVFGPNNFPFAFNGIAGGDFAAAIAAGNPVIAKGHSCHPETTRLFAEAALAAIQATEMPPGLVQLIYRTRHEDGLRMVSDSRVGAIGYTGARHTGLKLKEAADKAGTPAYLELSSINPVFLLPGALAERGEEIVDEFVASCLMGTGQFCTNPGLVVIPAGDSSNSFEQAVSHRFGESAVGTMLSSGVQASFESGIQTLQTAGAQLLVGGTSGGGTGFSFANTLLTVSGSDFLANPTVFQTEAFGNGSLLVRADDIQQMQQIAEALEGNLTGCIYSAKDGSDDDSYDIIAAGLRAKVGRLLNDKMPTGVAVCSAMNHGGPFPSTGHPGFTAVGFPASAARFGMLQSYDNVRHDRLPVVLQNKNPGQVWRCIDGQWNQADV